MRFRLLIVLVTIFCFLGSQLESTLAQPTQDLILIASFDRQGMYHAGEKLNLTIFAYLGETPVNLDEIYANLTDIYGGSLLVLNPVKINTGKYLVQYNITAGDVEKRFVITGNASGIKKTIYLSLPFDPPTKIYISFPDVVNITRLTPGKNVKFYVECFHNFTLTKPESIAAFLDFEGSQKTLNLSEEGKGRYSGNFTVPSLNHSASFKISASARINGKIEIDSVSIDYIPLSIWYRPVRITETSASFDIGLCDQNGEGVQNATITLNYTTDLGGTLKTIQGSTNSEGIAHFYIAPEIIVGSYIYIWGQTEASGTATKFQLSIPLATPERPSSGLDVIVSNSDYRDGNLKIEGTVYNNTKPLCNSTLLYFLKNWGEVHGNFSTDINGNFSTEIRNLESTYIHPYFGVTLTFVSADNSTLKTEEIIWLNLSTDLWLDSSLILEHGKVEFGKVLDLTLQNKKTFLTHMLYPPFAGIYDGELKTTGEFYTSWRPVIAGIYFLPVNTTTMWCSFPLPSFAYSGQKNITIAAIYYERGTFVPHMAVKRLSFVPDIRANFSVVLAGEDYIVVRWDKYESENFVKYEILVEGEGGWISIANITDKNSTKYRITAVNGEPLKGGKEYRIKLRIHFDDLYFEEIVDASTSAKVPGFTSTDLIAFLLLVVIVAGIIAKLRGKRCN